MIKDILCNNLTATISGDPYLSINSIWRSTTFMCSVSFAFKSCSLAYNLWASDLLKFMAMKARMAKFEKFRAYMDLTTSVSSLETHWKTSKWNHKTKLIMRICQKVFFTSKKRQMLNVQVLGCWISPNVTRKFNFNSKRPVGRADKN